MKASIAWLTVVAVLSPALEEIIAQLNALAESRETSRDELIRLEVAAFLEREPAFAAAYGMWADRGEDGVAYQERLRSEWERPTHC